MRKYIVELIDRQGIIVILQVVARDAAKARNDARSYAFAQGWGFQDSVKSHIIPEPAPEIVHLTTIHPKPVPVEVERTYNYTPQLEYA